MFKVWSPQAEKGPELTEDERSKRIKIFRGMIENGELKGQIETKDIIMISFLHARDWDIDAAYKRLTKFMKFRRVHPDWVIQEHPKAYEHLLLKNVTTVFDDRDKHGRRIYLINVSKIDPDNGVTMATLHQIHNAWFEMIIFEPETIVNGVAIILDVQGVSWKFIRWFSSNMASMTSEMAGLAPVRKMVLHVVNTTPVTVTLANCVMPFLGQRIRKKLHIHSSVKSLHEDLGSEVLPAEFGGYDTKSLDYDKLRESMYRSFNTHPKKSLRRMKCEPDLIVRPQTHDRLR